MRRPSAAMCLLAVLLGAAARAQAPELKRFNGPDGHCSVLMPGTPVYESQDVALDSSAKTQLNQWSVELEDQNVSYMLMYNDYPMTFINAEPAALLMKFRDGAVAGKTLHSDAAISLGGVPGRAFTATDKDGWLYDIHHYWQNQRLYQVMVVSAPGHAPEYRDAFMNSFQIK